MKLRHKLLLAFALTVFVCVAAVSWITSYLVKQTFEKADDERTTALVEQFRREFDAQKEEVAHRVEGIAASEATLRMAAGLSHGPSDYAAFLNDAATVAEAQQFDFLEFLDYDGTIVSSAQWPARFGYKEDIPQSRLQSEAFLQQETLPEGSALALVAIRKAGLGGSSIYVLGGRKLDKAFLAKLEPPAGMRAFFYQNLAPAYSPQLLIAPADVVSRSDLLAPLIRQVQDTSKERTMLVRWSDDPRGDERVDAIPLAGADGHTLGILLIASSRRAYVDLERHIRFAALVAGASGMVLALILSGWMASRVTRPVEQLAQVAKKVAAGDWRAQAQIASSDELGELADSFKRMTHELLEQKQRLLQAERVAAWRELARRLAHELKNPLFPLQLTVENLMRARELSPEQFDEIFRESSTTLLAEIANLKTIVSRFSEFSRMPQPRFEPVELNEVMKDCVRLYQPQFNAPGRPAIQPQLELAPTSELMAADPELLRRAVSNLIANAIDAMPDGGVLTLRTYQELERECIDVSDRGTGIAPEQCQRLFTPYFTTKAQGTGLGLAIVQSIVTDHGGQISVRSELGRGTTFSLKLPRNLEKLTAAEVTVDTAGT
jgi:two-component system, NtrC family, nitrogen regulation sensor histidine kinase NtrY